jgi:CheY-like chemotaxis protein
MDPFPADSVRDLRVMVVEDDMATRLLTRTFLEHLGFSDVVDRENGEHALKDVLRRHFDLIVSDLEMTPMSGWDLLLRIRRDKNVTNPYVPIILITSHSDRESVLRARDFGASAFVAKPVNYENLKKTISAVLADSRPFVQNDTYSGPDRRRKDKLPKDGKYQRESDYKW